MGLAITRPINDWCSNGNPAPPSGICPDGNPPGPAVAEGWDDWGPFYTAMYAQHVGLNGSTVEMCNSTGTGCLTGPSSPAPRGRLGALLAQETVVWSTLLFDVANRSELLNDQLEFYRRGTVNAPRPACCEPPFDVDNNWMHEYPTAYIIPMGAGQRSDPEANRLVEWMLDERHRGPRAQAGLCVRRDDLREGLVRRLAQPGPARACRHGARASASTSRPTSPSCTRHPASWSHGYLWGAEHGRRCPRDAEFTPITNRVTTSSHLLGGVEPGRRGPLRAGPRLGDRGPDAQRPGRRRVEAQLATAPFDSATGGDAPGRARSCSMPTTWSGSTGSASSTTCGSGG